MGTQLNPFPRAGHAKVAAREQSWERVVLVAYRAGAVILMAWIAAFAWFSHGWPLVNDAALMREVVFLTGKGMAPYRQIGDYNLPGSYAPEWLAVGLAGLLHVGVAPVWRAFDLGALALCGAAMVQVGRKVSWFAGIWAGALFALLHARDGIGQTGQRELWMTLLLLWAVVFLLDAMARPGTRAALVRVSAFGLCVSAAATLKPQALLWLVCLGMLLPLERPSRRRMGLVSAALLGALLPAAGVLVYLLRYHAVGAFVEALRLDLPYHLSLARRPARQLVAESMIPSLCKLSLLALLAWGLMSRAGAAPGHLRRLLQVLLLCTASGAVSLGLQGKGYTYQRYPMLAFLLLTLGVVLAQAVEQRGYAARAVGAAGLGFGILFCAPSYLRAAAHATWPQDAISQMESSLRAAAGPAGIRSLDGRVQCLDTVSGCTDALLELGLRPATGVLYDELVFPEYPEGSQQRGPLPAAVRRSRAELRQAILRQPPRVILLSSWLFPEGPGDYRELATWPWLASYLAEHYMVATERQYPRAENGPLGFRMYVLRNAAGD